MRILAAWGLSLAAAFHAGTVLAADQPVYKALPMAVKAPPPIVAPWAGFYFGGHVGWGWSKKQFVDNFPTFDGEIDARPRLDGVLGGLQAGYNFQWNWFVAGLEGDFSWADIDKKNFNCFFFGDQICSAETQWLATITGRIGGVVGPVLIYAKGGAAWARDQYTNVATCAGNQPIFRAGIFADCGTLFVGEQNRAGWIVGGGIEYMIAPHWSLKAEYNHMDFGKKSVGLFGENDNFFTEEIHQRVDVFKLGFNYHFLPTPLPLTARAQATGGLYTVGAGDDDDERARKVDLFSGVFGGRQIIIGWAGAFIALNNDLETSGPRLLILGGGGQYKYPSDAGSFRAAYTFGDVLAGWGFEGDNYSINLLAGVNVENHSLNRFDFDNTVQGTEAGAKIRASAYVNPTDRTLVYGEAEYSTAFQTFSAEGKFGYDLFGSGIFVGPEAGYFDNERTDSWRAGLHVSEINVLGVSVDVSGGFAEDKVVGTGAYGRLGVSRRY